MDQHWVLTTLGIALVAGKPNTELKMVIFVLTSTATSGEDCVRYNMLCAICHQTLHKAERYAR